MQPKKIDKSIYRILDANFNRSREGLRVCEDIARFIIKSTYLTRQLRNIRHNISSILKTLQRTNSIICGRDSARDFGKRFLKIKSKPKDSLDIFSANAQRTKESLRVLEEIFKIVDENISRRLTRLRFGFYTLEKHAIEKLGSLRRNR